MEWTDGRGSEYWVLARRNGKRLHLANVDRHEDAACGTKRPAGGWALIADGLGAVPVHLQNPCDPCERKVLR